MKRYIKNIAAILLAASVCACSEYDELENNGGYIPAPGETIKLVLNADKGEADVTPETRVFVGNTNGGKVTYYWNDGDQIGIVPLDMTNKSPNYVTEEVNINSSNKNQAQFAAYITGDDYSSQEPKLLIYYPFNESMLEGAKDSNGNFNYSTGKDFVSKHGLRFRLPQYQEQYGYSRTYTGHAAKDVNEHPSVWAVSNYGLAYDLAKSTITKDIETGHTDVTATGRFSLDHANTYFQFNVYGTQSPGGKNYADGTWKVASVSVEAGHLEITPDEQGNETVYTLSDKIALAGTYTLKYDYNATHFTGDATEDYGNNDKINLTAASTVTSVKINMNNITEAPFIKGTAADGVPAFAVINPLGIKENNASKNLNCLKVAVMCYKYDDKGNIVASDTRTRYYNIESIAGQDISGNFYSIDFEVCDPVESYSDLSVTDTANCYIISAPGNYSFNANVAGNGQLPYSTTTKTTSLGIDPTNLLQDGVNYGIDWLWASGISFDQIKEELGIASTSVSLSGDDAEDVVAKILNGVELSGKTGQISIGFAAGTSVKTLSGNIVLALYEKNTNGTAGDIVWTWHMWLGSPNTHHYKFPATNKKWQFTNEDWHMMDRNIGAETEELSNPRSTGLFYQRSRKEPMISWGDSSGSDTWTDNQLPTYRNTNVFGDRAQWTANKAYSNYNTLKYPMALITGYGASTKGGDYYYCWNASESKADDVTNNTKSMYDPCPVGYRMPTTREWDNLKNDVYQHQGGVQGTGVFGYCQWEELATAAKDLNDERIVEYLAHIAGGDYYTINEDFEREYHIKKNSGTGKEIITRFPNTGLLQGTTGKWMYYNEDSYTTEIVETTHPAGPELTARIETDEDVQENKTTLTVPDITNISTWSNYSSYFTVTLNGSNTYYYSIDGGATIKSMGNVSNFRIYPGSSTNNTNASRIYLGISSSNSGTSKTINIYKKSGDTYSNATTVTITKTSNSYSASYNDGGDAKEFISTTITTTNTLVVDFANSGSYSYATSESGPKTTISGKTFSIDCSKISYSYSSSNATYYFYSTSNGVISAATQITITRSGTSSSYSYTVATPVRGSEYTETSGGEFVSNSSASMALWSSGRVNDDNTFQTFWYGFGICPDGWSTKTNGVWGTNGNGSSPYLYDDQRTFCISYGPNQLGIYNNNSSAEKSTEPAIPIRCIREYDNNSTVAVAE